MPRPNAIETANRFRAQLAREEAAAAERMARIYNRIYQAQLTDLEALAAEIARAKEGATQEQLIKLARSRALLEQVKEQVARFGGTVQNEVALIQNQAVQAGIDNGLKLIEASLPDLPPETARLIRASFTRLHSDAIEAAAGLVGPDSPLTARLQEGYGEYVASAVQEHLLRGIAAGQGPNTIAARLQKNLLEGLGTGLTSALTTIRTAQIKSYQIANHATYLANSNIVNGWVWWAALDNNTCLSCVAQHGTVHDLDETLDDHHNGRCAPIPQTVSYRDLGLDIDEPRPEIETGAEWFKKQSAATQREMMGGATYRAYQAGRVDVRDFSRRYDDPVYGELLREASLKDILGKAAQEFYQR